MQRKMSTICFAMVIYLVVIGSAGICFGQSADMPSVTPAGPQQPTNIDPAAMDVLKKVEEAMINLKTYQAECWTTTVRKPSASGKAGKTSWQMATLVAAKPNLMRYDSWEMTVTKGTDGKETWKRKNLTPRYTFVCDGHTHWRQYGDMYHENDRTGPIYLNTILEPWGGFYTRINSPYSSLHYYQTVGQLREVRQEGTARVDDIACSVIFYHVKTTYEGEAQEYQTRLYVSQDGFVRRSSEEVTFGSKPGYTRDAIVRHIIANAPIRGGATLFSYTPPVGVKSEKEMESKQLPLLANGTVAPDFTVADSDGKTLRLSDLRGQVVVIDFWASWCGPCVASMPHNQEVAQKLQAEKLPVVFLAVADAEEQDAFATWVTNHKAFSALRFAFADRKKADISGSLYHVSAIPTQFVIDASGTIRASFVGFGGPTGDLEEAIRAALLPAK